MGKEFGNFVLHPTTNTIPTPPKKKKSYELREWRCKSGLLELDVVCLVNVQLCVCEWSLDILLHFLKGEVRIYLFLHLSYSNLPISYLSIGVKTHIPFVQWLVISDALHSIQCNFFEAQLHCKIQIQIKRPSIVPKRKKKLWPRFRSLSWLNTDLVVMCRFFNISTTNLPATTRINPSSTARSKIIQSIFCPEKHLEDIIWLDLLA